MQCSGLLRGSQLCAAITRPLKDAELLLKKFGAPNKPAGGKYDMWPRYPGVFIRRPVEHDAGDAGLVRITFRRQKTRRAKHMHWFWLARRADAV
ncbi:hypothetical protein A9G00_26980 [Achromobacter xylosoxidans]|uniref:hypothetical protein n=1 Tax=Achromobacter ruhlandii TaxID=72557 RepID=UPI00083A015A|nr:hypothetical protein [Achromobacter ruhlandii]MCZ8397006.1 hypothetical protein [Achromobacter ruhlandii]ODA12495.1 hypothetical protein A9G00_26980 [Achromobacter xylosoxidans]CAB3877655.1 hypothetical protein LMG1864_03110 [Achromobacter ruhlandii]